MARSSLRRWLVVAGASVALIAYLIVVDLGISAGRIHHGVKVQGVDLGGLTEREATVRLRARARELKRAPIELSGHGLDRSLKPTDVRWRPRPEKTAAAALGVGREDAPLGALWDRLRAWFTGVELEWAGRPKPASMVAYVDEVAADATAFGLDVDRAALRRSIRLAITTWPRETVPIPLKGA